MYYADLAVSKLTFRLESHQAPQRDAEAAGKGTGRGQGEPGREETGSGRCVCGRKETENDVEETREERCGREETRKDGKWMKGRRRERIYGGTGRDEIK